MAQWAWTYLTHRRGDRLITGEPPYPVLGGEEGIEVVESDRFHITQLLFQLLQRLL
ncbi:MAG: hypothetical protein R3C44_19535 [Chloroflexota bacterium]